MLLKRFHSLSSSRAQRTGAQKNPPEHSLSSLVVCPPAANLSHLDEGSGFLTGFPQTHSFVSLSPVFLPSCHPSRHPIIRPTTRPSIIHLVIVHLSIHHSSIYPSVIHPSIFQKKEDFFLRDVGFSGQGGDQAHCPYAVVAPTGRRGGWCLQVPGGGVAVLQTAGEE